MASITILDAPYAVAVVSLTLFGFEGMQVVKTYLLKYTSHYDNIDIPENMFLENCTEESKVKLPLICKYVK